MRTLYLLGLSAITVTFFACSSGGVGSPTLLEPPIGGSGKGAEGSAFGPNFSASGGGTDTPKDSGTSGDTGSPPVDTGVKDTGSSTGDTSSAICTSTCSADSASAATACQNAINGTTCKSQYLAYYTCRSENRVCDSSNKTDESVIASACSSEQSAVTSCLGG